MGGSLIAKESKHICGPDYFEINGPDRGPDCNILKF
jgi:hypothetical protein